VALACAALVGCAQDPKPTPLEPSAFAAPTGEVDSTLDAAFDPPKVVPATATSPRLAPAVEAATRPSVPATRATSGPVPGQYLVLGAVVAEANGVPIYADKIIRDLEPLLSARAKELDAEQFQKLAVREIAQRIMGAISDELEYAAAQRNLDERDKQYARAMTEQWRQQQTTLAGGSIELAREKFSREGRSFDEELAEQEKMNLSRLFLSKRVNPRIAVTRAEMVEYYERNRDALFTEHGQARFRVIRIDPAKIGGPDAAARALELVQQIHEQARRGEDFATLAEKYNSDTRYARMNQQLTPVKSGMFSVAEVEKAAWALQAGQVSDVIDAGQAFYLVQLVGKEEGRVRPFESPEVQDQIEQTLRTEQRAKLREQYIGELSEGAMIRGNPRNDPRMMQPAVDIAVQRYPVWRAG
jgi:parvulin-like peptidyl-prolyl isomerase